MEVKLLLKNNNGILYINDQRYIVKGNKEFNIDIDIKTAKNIFIIVPYDTNLEKVIRQNYRRSNEYRLSNCIQNELLNLNYDSYPSEAIFFKIENLTLSYRIIGSLELRINKKIVNSNDDTYYFGMKDISGSRILSMSTNNTVKISNDDRLFISSKNDLCTL